VIDPDRDAQKIHGAGLPEHLTLQGIIVDHWGPQHSWVPEFKCVLEGWIRASGRNEDADALRGDVEELIEEDEIDEWPEA
jgi:hypothetical protein